MMMMIMMIMMIMMMTNIAINNTLVNCTYVKHMLWKVHQGKMLCNNMSQTHHHILSINIVNGIIRQQLGDIVLSLWT